MDERDGKVFVELPFVMKIFLQIEFLRMEGIMIDFHGNLWDFIDAQLGIAMVAVD
jgi:hypothetical protein